MPSEDSPSRVCVLFGVAGCGKTTLGKALCERLNALPDSPRDAVFVDADDLHTPEAREKMSKGVALTDTDRAPWLARVRARVMDAARPDGPGGSGTPRNRDVILACSALKREYRSALVSDAHEEAPWLGAVDFVHLRVPASALESRLAARQKQGTHFFPKDSLRAQLETLEMGRAGYTSEGGLCATTSVDADVPVEKAVDVLYEKVIRNAVERASWESSLRLFLDRWHASLVRLGLGSEVSRDRGDSPPRIDHVCFRCSTETQYVDVLRRLKKLGHVAAGSSVVGGRIVTTVRLIPPARWRGFWIPAVEVPMPKPGRPKPDGWEHAEVALMRGGVHGPEHLRALLAKYPGVLFDAKGLRKDVNPELSCDLGDGATVKFHNRPLLEVVAYEIERGWVRPPSEDDRDAEDAAEAEEGSRREDPDERSGGKRRKTLEERAYAWDPSSEVYGVEIREPWVSLLANGEKTIETRAYPLPKELLNIPLVLLATPGLLPGELPKSTLRDASAAGAARIVGAAVFSAATRYATKREWVSDFHAHRVPDEEGNGFAWDGPERSGPMFAWRVARVWRRSSVSRPSPPMRRAFRSLFRLDAETETVLGLMGDSGEDDEDDGKGRWDDDGANDRPWH
jgi:carbohydrate kinase (thermoresistant glucokinase family)